MYITLSRVYNTFSNALTVGVQNNNNSPATAFLVLNPVFNDFYGKEVKEGQKTFDYSKEKNKFFGINDLSSMISYLKLIKKIEEENSVLSDEDNKGISINRITFSKLVGYSSYKDNNYYIDNLIGEDKNLLNFVKENKPYILIIEKEGKTEEENEIFVQWLLEFQLSNIIHSLKGAETISNSYLITVISEVLRQSNISSSSSNNSSGSNTPSSRNFSLNSKRKTQQNSNNFSSKKPDNDSDIPTDDYDNNSNVSSNSEVPDKFSVPIFKKGLKSSLAQSSPKEEENLKNLNDELDDLDD